MLDDALQKQLLKSFPNTKYLGVVYRYDTGHSGAPVFAVHYKSKNKYGLNGTFIVKIGPEEWAEKEQDFYDNLPADEAKSLILKGHMHTPSLEGQAAVAYEVAFDRIITPITLMQILDEADESEQEAQQQIKKLAHALVDWYLQKTETLVLDLHALLHHMLTEKRTSDLLQRIEKALPFWKPEVSSIMIDGKPQRLPNPLAYKLVCEKISHNPVCLTTRIHGDLHTGNVICFLQSEYTPKLIDFDQSVPDGVPFFDLAYLEFDIIRHLLSVEQPNHRKDWLSLLDASMTNVQDVPQIRPWGASRAWRFLEPLREEVARLIENGRDTYEAVWWLSTVATGLNFARKGDETRSKFERVAGLLYAAYGLDRLLKMFRVKESPIKEAPYIVSWIEGAFLSPNVQQASTPSPPQKNLSDALANATPPPEPAPRTTEKEKEVLTPALSPLSTEATPPLTREVLTQTYLPTSSEPDLMPASEAGQQEPESDFLSSAVQTSAELTREKQTSALEMDTEQYGKKQEGERKRSEYFSATTADKLQHLLQEASDLFQAGGYVFKDRCESVDETLQQFADFLQSTLPDVPHNDTFTRFTLQNLLTAQRKLRAELGDFRENCPPAPAKKLSETRYDKARAAISNKLEKLQAEFLELRERTC